MSASLVLSHTQRHTASVSTSQVPEVHVAFCPHRKSPQGHVICYAHITQGRTLAHLCPHHRSSWEKTAFFVPPGMWDLGFPTKDRPPVPPAVEVQSQRLDRQGSPWNRRLCASVPPVVWSTHPSMCCISPPGASFVHVTAFLRHPPRLGVPTGCPFVLAWLYLFGCVRS